MFLLFYSLHFAFLNFLWWGWGRNNFFKEKNRFLKKQVSLKKPKGFLKLGRQFLCVLKSFPMTLWGNYSLLNRSIGLTCWPGVTKDQLCSTAGWGSWWKTVSWSPLPSSFPGFQMPNQVSSFPQKCPGPPSAPHPDSPQLSSQVSVICTPTPPNDNGSPSTKADVPQGYPAQGTKQWIRSLPSRSQEGTDDYCVPTTCRPLSATLSCMICTQCSPHNHFLRKVFIFAL